jgi:DNA end-binding protein Ku
MRGYDLLRSVLEETKKVAVGKVRLRTRARLALLRPRGRLFALDMMRFAEELVAGDELAPAEQKTPSPREKQLALHLVNELSGRFDPSKHPDEYRAAVLAAVDEKVEAGEVAHDTVEREAAAGGAPTGAQVIDLAELLARSIKGTGKPGNMPGPAKTKADPAVESHPDKISRSASARKKKAAG